MISFEARKDAIVAIGNNFEIEFSLKHGGTLRKWIKGGIDLGITRQGCEYWIDNNIHYEQEFGEVIRNTINGNLLIVEATLVSPQLKTIGGRCLSSYEILDSGIMDFKSILFPTDKINSYDSYICFNHEMYSEYKFHGKIEGKKKIIAPNNETDWFTEIVRNPGTSSVYGDHGHIDVIPDSNMILGGIYRSIRMLEIKYHALEKSEGYKHPYGLTFEGFKNV
jgi:hypothetical protein